MSDRKPQTGPLPGTTQIATSDNPNSTKNKRDALLMLDNLEELQASEKLMLHELTFNYGYTEEQAGAVYREWLRLQ